MAYSVVKRILDLMLAIMCVAVFVIPFVVLAAMVRLRIGSPIFFRQDRIGLKERSFALVKFRTMIEARGNDGRLLPDGERLTGFGRWLRKTSLDEIPEVWNILRGDMSFVGPRPLLPEYLDFYTPDQARRHDVLPGLTGWAQVNGRNAISWEQRFALDLEYVRRRAFSLDVYIMLLTIVRVVQGAGVNHMPDQPMPRLDDHIRSKRSTSDNLH